jgi:hypothetical protein
MLLMVAACPLRVRATPDAPQPAWHDARLDNLNVEGQTLSEAVATIADKLKVTLVCDWPALRPLGVDPSEKLHGRLQNVRVDRALQYIFNEAGGNGEMVLSPAHRGWAVSGWGVASPEPTIETRYYNVRKLIASLRQSVPTTQPAGAPKTDSGGGAVVVSAGGSDAHEQTQLSTLETVDSLIKNLSTTVDPDSWRDAGGTVGSINELGGILIVTQTPGNLAKIEKFLHDLESASAK